MLLFKEANLYYFWQVSKCVKIKNAWFNHECAGAKREFRAAKTAFRKNKSSYNRNILLEKRRMYRSVKRKALACFKAKQKKSFT
jgi:hypothetical protein